jgi:predicted MPP superfamily phosphohydrolase
MAIKENLKIWYFVILFLLSISIFLGQFIFWAPIQWVSGFWMAIIGYGILVLPVANILYYFMKKRGTLWIGMGVITFFVTVTIIGSINAWNPMIRSYNVSIEKTSEIPKMKILVASDLHLGTIVDKSHLEKLVNISQEVKPDIILLAGDIIDDHIEPYLKNQMGETMKKLDAPLGVYAVSGNHDVYGNDLPQLVQEMNKAGIHFLRDQAVSIKNQFYLIGRNDLAEGERKEISTLVKNIDDTKPILMIDHQPTELNEAKENGIDLLFSGHTHNGQLAPANLITGMLFENDGGYLKKENLHSFVSSGFGTWGPPLRIGSRSEVMVINLELNGRD